MPTSYQHESLIHVKNLTRDQIRLGLQSVSGYGKTWSGCTFPNVLMIDLDRNTVGLKNHPNSENITILPFWDPAFCAKWALPKFPNPTHELHRPNQRDAVLKWLRAEGPKLQSDTTLFVDSWTALQDAFDVQTDLEPAYTKQGQIDEYEFWMRKQTFSRDVLMLLKGLKCNAVIVSFHEQCDKDVTGTIVKKVEPLMQGKFVGKIGNYFTDFFRCCVFDKIDPKTQKPFLKPDGKTKEVEYLWQIRSDSLLSLKTRMKVESMFVPANYSSFEEYY